MDIWIISSGKKIPVTCMKDSHLENAIKMVQRILNKPGEKDHYLAKLRMLNTEKMRRKCVMDKYVWCKAPTGDKAHQVLRHANGDMSHMARCGVRQRTANWSEYPSANCEMVCCQRCLALIKEDSKKVETPKVEKIEVEANYLQVVGPEIPLCWIPVDDIKAVVMLLVMHQPKSESLKIVQAQFNTAIEKLNQYIQEAQDRNVQGGVITTTWTHPGEKQKGK